MSGPIYKDSYGQCDAPSMLYDTIRNPNAAKAVVKAVVKGKDTIDLPGDVKVETTQERLNRETLEKFEKNGSNLSSETFVAVVKIGKYAFMAIMLPPYLCLYGIPRWMLLNALPKAFDFVNTQATKIGHLVQDFAKKIADIMKGALDQTLGEALRFAGRFTRNLYDSFTKGWQKITQNFLSVKGLIDEKLVAFTNRFQELREKFDNLLFGSIDKLPLIAKNIQEGLIKFGKQVSSILEKITQPLINVLTPPILKIADFIQKMENKLSNGIKEIQNRAEKMISKTKEFFIPVFLPINDYMQEKMLSTKNLFNRFKERFASKSDDDTKTSKSQEMLQMSVEVIKQSFQAIPVFALQLFNWIKKNALEENRKKFKRAKEQSQRWKSAVKGFVVGAASGITEYALLAKSKFYSLMLKIIRWLITKICIASAVTKKLILAFPRMSKTSFMKVYQTGRRFFKSCFFKIRMGIALIYVACIQGMKKVREFDPNQ